MDIIYKNTIHLSNQNFGKLQAKLREKKFEKYGVLELFFKLKNKKIVIYNGFFEKIFTFKNMD